MNLLPGAFKQPCKIFIKLANSNTQEIVKTESGEVVTLPVFQNKDTVSGEVWVDPIYGKKLEHLGVKIELVGQIEFPPDKDHYDFTSLVRELDVPGVIADRKVYPFEFQAVEMSHDSYYGAHVKLRNQPENPVGVNMDILVILKDAGIFWYILRVIVGRSFPFNLVATDEFLVCNFSPAPELLNNIKVEVGIDDCLQIEFEYDKNKYHLNDVIIGKIYFRLVRIKIKHMDLEIRRRESTGSGSNRYVDVGTIAKYELMDGAPARGESIPVRLFLNHCKNLTPTYLNVHNKFSVKYFLNLVLVDEEDRRYFKQQEVTLYRSENSMET